MCAIDESGSGAGAGDGVAKGIDVESLPPALSTLPDVLVISDDTFSSSSVIFLLTGDRGDPSAIGSDGLTVRAMDGIFSTLSKGQT